MAQNKNPFGLPQDFKQPASPEQHTGSDRFQFNPNFESQNANPFLDTPLLDIPDEPAEAEAPRKRSPLSIALGILFYLLLAAAIVFSVHKTHQKVSTLDQELEEYELSQAPHFAQSLFAQHFASPDWGALYDAAAPEILSQYEGRDAYIRYIEAKVGTQPLTYQYRRSVSDAEMEYGVYLNKEQIASFSIVNTSSDPGAPVWKEGDIKLLFTTDQSYQIRYAIGHTVHVNGVPLDEGTLVKSTQWLPANVLRLLEIQFPRIGTNTHEIQGLMSQPLVTIQDALGNAIPVSYDEDTHTFSEAAGPEAIPAQVRDLALEAVHTYCRFMIREVTSSSIDLYFKPGTDTHSAIVSSPSDHLQTPKAYAFTEEEVSDLVYYTDTLYSVHVGLSMQLTREDGTVKIDRIEKNLFFQQNLDGTWICTNMTGEPLFDEVTTVRVKFVQDGNVLSSRMIDQQEPFIYCPDPEIPTELADNSPAHVLKKNNPSQLEKISFAGWGLLLQDKQGKPYYQPVFQVGLDRKAEVPGGLLNDPVTLYPIFVWEKIK